MKHARLELLKAATLPAPVPEWIDRCTFDFSLLRLLAFPLAHDRIGIGDPSRSTLPQVEFVVPAKATRVTIHPDFKRLAALLGQDICICDIHGNALQRKELDLSWGQARALAFTHDGGRLLISFEAGISDGAGEHNIVALDIRTLDYLTLYTVNGDIEAQHHISVHPSEPIVALDVACGQDGTWSNIFSVASNQISLLHSINPHADYAPIVFFSPDGKFFVGNTESRIQAWTCTEPALVANEPASEDEHFGFGIGFWDEQVIALVDAESAGWRLHLRALPSLTLKYAADLGLPPQTTNILPIGQGLLVSSFVTHKNRISPADRKPESKTYQLWRVLPPNT